MDNISNKNLEILTQKYVNSLREKKENITNLQLHLDDCHWRDGAKLNELYQIIHKLGGSAGSYGFSALSDAAMMIDQQLKNKILGTDTNDALSDEISLLLSEIQMVYENHL